MEFYCESCETAMCLDCTEGEHREHVTVPLRDVVEQHKAVLKTQLDAIRSRWGFDSVWKFPSFFLHTRCFEVKHLAQIFYLPSKISCFMLCSVWAQCCRPILVKNDVIPGTLELVFKLVILYFRLIVWYHLAGCLSSQQPSSWWARSLASWTKEKARR